MTALTSQLLDNFPYTHYTDPGSIQRGRDYYKRGNVWHVQLIGNNKAVCSVEGNSGEYEVTIEVDKKGSLNFDCDCPYADDGNFCKHMVAAALETSEYLKGGKPADDDEDDWDDEEEWEEDYEDDDDEENEPINIRRPVSPPLKQPTQSWQSKVEETLSLASPRSSSSNLTRYVAVVLLTRSQMGFYGYGSAYRPAYHYSLEPLTIKSDDWYRLTGGEKKSPQEINHYLETSKNWLKASERMFRQVNPAGCLNMDADSASVLNILSNAMQFGMDTSNLPMFLSFLAKLDVPIFLGSRYPEKLERRVHLLPNPIEVKIDIQRDETRLALRAGYEQDGQFIYINKQVEIVSSVHPGWILMDDRLAQIRNPQALSILPSFPIEIPIQQEDDFRERYFARIAQTLPIKSNLVKWNSIKTDAVPRLYLRDDNKDKTLRADLRFGYADYEVAASKNGDVQSVETVPDSWELVRIQRQPEQEQHFYQLLTDPSFRLKRASSTFPFGTLELRARAHPFDFLLHSIPLLTQAGFEIYGEDDLQ